jgi:hypothetical protein
MPFEDQEDDRNAAMSRLLKDAYAEGLKRGRADYVVALPPWFVWAVAVCFVIDASDRVLTWFGQ